MTGPPRLDDGSVCRGKAQAALEPRGHVDRKPRVKSRPQLVRRTEDTIVVDGIPTGGHGPQPLLTAALVGARPRSKVGSGPAGSEQRLDAARASTQPEQYQRVEAEEVREDLRGLVHATEARRLRQAVRRSRTTETRRQRARSSQ